MCIHGKCFINVETKGFDRLREWYVITRDGHKGKVTDDLTYPRPCAKGHMLSLLILNLLSLIHLATS